MQQLIEKLYANQIKYLNEIGYFAKNDCVFSSEDIREIITLFIKSSITYQAFTLRADEEDGSSFMYLKTSMSNTPIDTSISSGYDSFESSEKDTSETIPISGIELSAAAYFTKPRRLPLLLSISHDKENKHPDAKAMLIYTFAHELAKVFDYKVISSITRSIPTSDYLVFDATPPNKSSVVAHAQYLQRRMFVEAENRMYAKFGRGGNINHLISTPPVLDYLSLVNTDELISSQHKIRTNELLEPDTALYVWKNPTTDIDISAVLSIAIPFMFLDPSKPFEGELYSKYSFDILHTAYFGLISIKNIKEGLGI